MHIFAEQATSKFAVISCNLTTSTPEHLSNLGSLFGGRTGVRLLMMEHKPCNY